MKSLATASVFAFGFLLSGEALAKGNFGLGLVGEDPSGLTFKYKMSEQQALDFRFGLGFRFDNAFLVQVNYLISPFMLTQNGDFKLPFYIGGGGTLFIFGDNLGLTGRVPIGAAMELSAIPIDIFLEIAPQLALIPNVAVGVDGAVGVRFWF